MYHGRDQTKTSQLMQEQLSDYDDYHLLSKEKALEAFRVQQEIQMDQMDSVLQDGMSGKIPDSEDGQIKLIMKMLIQ